MNFQFVTPGPPLGEFVERIWQLSDAPAHDREQIVPSGTIEFVFNLCEDEVRIYDPRQPDPCRRYSGAVASGAYGGPFVIDTREHGLIVGVHFKPGGAAPFLGVSATALRDTHVDLETLWGRAATELRGRLCEAATPTERFQILESALVAHGFRGLGGHPAVRFALHAFRDLDHARAVREVAREAGLSQRRFIQLFSREVGVPPKLFCRIRRFQQALAFAGLVGEPPWGPLAIESGYYDQAHLIRDFREFSGYSPTEYVRRRSPRVMENHVPVA